MSTCVYTYDVLQDHSYIRAVVSLLVSFQSLSQFLSEYRNAYLSDDMISYIYFALNVFTGSNRALRKMILEMIKYFTLPI